MMKSLLVGCGYMAKEYVAVLNDLQIVPQVIGFSKENAELFEKTTGLNTSYGGLDKFLANNASTFSHVIIATNVSSLAKNIISCIDFGIKDILVEKPAGVTSSEVIKAYNHNKASNISVAYNRRYFASVRKAKTLIEQEGGAKTCHFDFTERSHEIEKLNKPPIELQNWLLANSSHVIDMAFNLVGYPSTIKAYSSGKLAWHKKSLFSGIGITDSNCYFTYNSNWNAGGQWKVEITTEENKYVFRPLEQLKVIRKGRSTEEPIEISDDLDNKFKPGLRYLVDCFFSGSNELCSLEEHVKMLPIYENILG